MKATRNDKMTFNEFMKKYYNIDILGDDYQSKSEKIKRYYKQQFLSLNDDEIAEAKD